jgi:hypothetical protein
LIFAQSDSKMNTGYDRDVWELMGRPIFYFFRMTTAAAFVLLIATSSARAQSSAEVALGDTPITAGDADRAGTLPPPPPYDPATALLPGPVKPTDEPDYNPTPTMTPTAVPTPSRVHIDGVQTDLVPTPGQLAYKATRDISYIDPLSWSVTIFKKRHQLVLYYKGRMFKNYHAVFGRSFEPGTKLWEGDRRTPEGVYAIIGKHPSSRWEWFLTLNYPNVLDRRRYEQLRDGGVVPIEDGRPVGVGGRIGIHGSDEPALNRGDVNWTTGCISVSDQDIDELYKLLPVGTVVIINP